jgi:hypothetical protein
MAPTVEFNVNDLGILKQNNLNYSTHRQDVSMNIISRLTPIKINIGLK